MDIKVFPLSARSLQVTFSPPKAESRNGRLLGYYLGYKATEIDEHFMFKKVSISEYTSDGIKPMEVVLNDLKRATKYAVIAQAFNRYSNLLIHCLIRNKLKINFQDKNLFDRTGNRT